MNQYSPIGIKIHHRIRWEYSQHPNPSHPLSKSKTWENWNNINRRAAMSHRICHDELFIFLKFSKMFFIFENLIIFVCLDAKRV